MGIFWAFLGAKMAEKRPFFPPRITPVWAPRPVAGESTWQGPPEAFRRVRSPSPGVDASADRFHGPGGHYGGMSVARRTSRPDSTHSGGGYPKVSVGAGSAGGIPVVDEWGVEEVWVTVFRPRSRWMKAARDFWRDQTANNWGGEGPQLERPWGAALQGVRRPEPGRGPRNAGLMAPSAQHTSLPPSGNVEPGA